MPALMAGMARLTKPRSVANFSVLRTADPSFTCFVALTPHRAHGMDDEAGLQRTGTCYRCFADRHKAYSVALFLYDPAPFSHDGTGHPASVLKV